MVAQTRVWLFADDFHADSLRTLAVEFNKKDELPGAEVEAPFGERDDYLVMEQQALEVDGGIAFEAALVLVVVAGGRELLEPDVEIGEEAGLFVVDDDGGIRVERSHDDNAVTEGAFLHGGFHLPSDVEDFADLRGLERDGFVVDFHRVLGKCGGILAEVDREKNGLESQPTGRQAQMKTDKHR